MDYQPIKSSNLKEVAYDYATQTLGLRFNTGNEYHYSPVSENMYRDFMAAESKGTYFAQWIKKNPFITCEPQNPK
jgi:hypothetical protein